MPTWRGTINSNWGTAGNWDTGVLPSSALAGSDAIFDSLSPNCTVNITNAVCRNLNFTGYTNTITMTNAITVGSASSGNPNHTVTLSSTMIVAGTGAIITRANGTTTLISNGKVWPNTLALNNVVVAAGSIAQFNDNWTTGNLTIGASGNQQITIQGAFTVTVNGDLTIAITGGASSSVLASAASLTTIKLAGTGTWSSATTFVSAATSMVGFAVPINIDTAGTITITNGCCYGGGSSVTGTALTHINGTVTHSGTFHLLGNQGGNGYTVTLKGSTSPSATTTNTNGINFQNLSFTTFSVGAAPGACTIVGNICVVNSLSTTVSSGGKYPIATTGGTIYANGGFTHNASMRTSSTTILVLQGTGTWVENNITIGGSTFWGTAWQVQINTTGTITVGSNIGVANGGSLTYTAGTFTWGVGYILYALNASFYGLGTYGIQIDELNEVGGGVGTTVGFNDTTPIKFGTIRIINAITNYSFFQTGSIGWTCNNFYMQLTASSTGTNLRLQAGVEYKINSVLTMTAFVPNGTTNIVLYSSSTTAAIWTLAQGATQDVYYVDGGSGSFPIDSSAGQTIWTRGGTIIAGTLNWKNWDYPRTRFSTFIS